MDLLSVSMLHNQVLAIRSLSILKEFSVSSAIVCLCSSSHSLFIDSACWLNNSAFLWFVLSLWGGFSFNSIFPFCCLLRSSRNLSCKFIRTNCCSLDFDLSECLEIIHINLLETLFKLISTLITFAALYVYTARQQLNFTPNMRLVKEWGSSINGS